MVCGHGRHADRGADPVFVVGGVADVDHALSDFVGMMPWPRFAKILSAAVLEAEPALAAERARRTRRL